MIERLTAGDPALVDDITSLVNAVYEESVGDTATRLSQIEDRYPALAPLWAVPTDYRIYRTNLA
ncbi:hypothetical protein [Actinoplanes sp. NBRC 103695]|uniref:hypothetical protein n=1 Tax=Actinoplanes sp. NBRC 103695 TaxID=3032202 RepID=UPI0024A15063|nr:hypothetical protein [Actinoplanes sp. NBRC 103695]GLY99923.1 hypothetical protein Acsp02_71760 [Actinoplanes sp. NBRC 103695]